MKRFNLYLAVPVLLILALASCTSQKPAPPPETVKFETIRSMLWIASSATNKDSEKILVDSMYIPGSAVLYLWTPFETGEKIKYSSNASIAGLRSGSKEMIPLEAFKLFKVDVEFLAPEESEEAGKRFSISFPPDELVSNGGETLYQPAEYAFLRAVESSRKKTGYAKIVSLVYAKSIFTASVLVR
jgi:hypothetical protein